MDVQHTLDQDQAQPSGIDARSQPGPFDRGSESVVDVFGCDPFALQDLQLLERLCNRVIDDLGLNVVGAPQWHQFPDPGGVTGLYLLSESHLACHTYPENGFASFNLYCCRAHTDWPWETVLREELSAARVEVRRLERGTCGGKDLA